MALTNNLILYYKLDENTGTTINDSSGNSVTGTLINSTWNTGIINSAVAFTSTTSDKITFTVTAAIANAVRNQITFSCWVFRATNDATNRRIIDGNGAGFSGFLIQTGNGDFNVGVIFNPTTAGAIFANAIPTSTWTHLLFTWDVANNIPSLFINGASVTPTSTTNKSGTQDDWTGTNTILGNRSSNDRVFNGTIDEIAMWSRILSNSEISQLYNSGAGLQYPFTNQTIWNIAFV